MIASLFVKLLFDIDWRKWKASFCDKGLIFRTSAFFQMSPSIYLEVIITFIPCLFCQSTSWRHVLNLSSGINASHPSIITTLALLLISYSFCISSNTFLQYFNKLIYKISFESLAFITILTSVVFPIPASPKIIRVFDWYLYMKSSIRQANSLNCLPITISFSISDHFISPAKLANSSRLSLNGILSDDAFFLSTIILALRNIFFCSSSNMTNTDSVSTSKSSISSASSLIFWL